MSSLFSCEVVSSSAIRIQAGFVAILAQVPFAFKLALCHCRWGPFTAAALQLLGQSFWGLHLSLALDILGSDICAICAAFSVVSSVASCGFFSVILGMMQHENSPLNVMMQRTLIVKLTCQVNLKCHLLQHIVMMTCRFQMVVQLNFPVMVKPGLTWMRQNFMCLNLLDRCHAFQVMWTLQHSSQHRFGPGLDLTAGALFAGKTDAESLAGPTVSKPVQDAIFSRALLTNCQTSEILLPWETGFYKEFFSDEPFAQLVPKMPVSEFCDFGNEPEPQQIAQTLAGVAVDSNPNPVFSRFVECKDEWMLLRQTTAVA